MPRKSKTGSVVFNVLKTNLSDSAEPKSIDVSALAEVISVCFDLSMTVGLDLELRENCLVAGKRLRGTLVNLLSARFESSSSEFQQAAANLADINKRLKRVREEIEKAAKLMKDIGGLIGQLDGLLKFALAFV